MLSRLQLDQKYCNSNCSGMSIDSSNIPSTLEDNDFVKFPDAFFQTHTSPVVVAPCGFAGPGPQ